MGREQDSGETGREQDSGETEREGERGSVLLQTSDGMGYIFDC